MGVEEKWIGRHHVLFDPDGDLFEIAVHDKILPGEMGAFARECDGRLLERGRLFILCDLRDSNGTSPGSRMELTGRPRKLPPHVIAYVGAGFSLRVVLEMINRAATVLSGAKIAVRFFDTPEEARAWLIEMRERGG